MAGDGEVSVRFSSQNEADLFRALVQVAQRVSGIKDALGQTNEVAKKVDPALKRFAESVKSISSTPIQELAAANRRLDDAIKANVLTEEQAAGARAKAQEKYRAELRRTREEMATSSKVVVGADGLPSLQDSEQVSAVDLYKRRVAELRADLKSGAIDQKTFAAASRAAAREYAEEMRTVKAEQEKANAALKKFALDLVKVDSTPLDRHKERMEKVNAALSKGVIQQKEFEAAAKKSYDTYQAELADNIARLDKMNAKTRETAQAASGSFAGMADTAKLAWAAVAAYVYTGLNDIQQAAQQAGDKLKAASATTGTIAQISETKEQFEQLKKAAETALAMGAAKDYADAQSFIVAMENANAMDEFSQFANLRKFGVMEQPERMIGAATGLQTSMGKDATGTKTQLAMMGFVAGKAAPDTAEEVLAGAGKAGVAAKQQGATTEELLAVTAILSKAFGGSDVGGDRAKEFFSKLAIAEPKLDARGRVAANSPLKESLRGKSLEEVLGNQQLAAMTPAQLQRSFGSDQFSQAYGTLLEAKDEVLALTKKIRDARDKDLATIKIEMAQSDPRSASVIAGRAAAGQLELQRQRQGVQSIQADRITAEMASMPIEQSQAGGKGPQGLARYFSYFFNPGAVFFGPGEKSAREQQIASTGAEKIAQYGRMAFGDEAFATFMDRTKASSDSLSTLEQIQRDQTRVLEEVRRNIAELNSKVSPKSFPAPRVNLAPSARQEQAAASN